MSRWLVTGARGQLGTDLIDVLGAVGADVIATDVTDLDICDPAAVSETLNRAAPTIVVNCAAYTAVDACEEHEEQAFDLNARAPGYLARWCAAHSARLIHISTDYVFAGDATSPYSVDDPVAPRSAYGRTKAAGESAVLETGGDAHIVRTAWVYGAEGQNFVKTMARLAKERDTVDVVNDQHGSPTWSVHLARGLAALGTAAVPPGIWHCTGGGATTWFDFARAIFVELGLNPDRVHPTTTAAFPRPAPRPAYSVLSNDKWIRAGLPEMPDWREALFEAIRTFD